MPELPEVETTVRKLKPLIVGKRILNLSGKKILNIERKGKAILICLSGGKILGFHQRMSGKLLIVPHGTRDKHIRRTFCLSGLPPHLSDRCGGGDLVFHDVRKFGVVWYGDSKKVLGDPYFKTLGKDALEISLRDFRKLFKTKYITPLIPLTLRGTKIKSFLLNQKNLAGVGNIVADEVLWRAKIHPEREVRSLSGLEVRNLWKSIKFILNRSIKSGGTTMRDWLHPEGTRGAYFEKRFIYDREGEPCRRCRAGIIRKKISGRSGYFCPRCQKI
ncbi:MAG: hypothetical protein HYW15_00315 [Candidatus Giovannonibacteria bacterium]|nr:MAG: hypothetical protein HYW15_00315 [Candidatus Giovannonibacteria bacterium]